MWQGAGIEPAAILRYCAISWKVVGSTPDCVIGIFPSNHAMVLGLTQPLTEMFYKEYFLWDESSQCVGLIVLKSGTLNLLEPSGHVQACNGIVLPYYYDNVSHHTQSDTAN